MTLESEALPASYWQRRYAEGTTGWDRGQSSPGLSWFVDRAKREGWRRILVPGCGRGHEVVALAEAGFDLTALDYAETAVELVRDRLRETGSQAVVIQTDVLEFDNEFSFDAIYEQTCLCALHPIQWAAYERKLAQWLRPGGTLFAMFMQTTQPQGPPFACPLSRMRELFAVDRWQWSPIVGRVDHPLGLHEWACELRRHESFET
jgi:SAM-dependent methyltransferase